MESGPAPGACGLVRVQDGHLTWWGSGEHPLVDQGRALDQLDPAHEQVLARALLKVADAEKAREATSDV